MTGLIVASFGTLDDAERARTIDAIENDLIVAFPSMAICRRIVSVVEVIQ